MKTHLQLGNDTLASLAWSTADDDALWAGLLEFGSILRGDARKGRYDLLDFPSLLLDLRRPSFPIAHATNAVGPVPAAGGRGRHANGRGVVTTREPDLDTGIAQDRTDIAGTYTLQSLVLMCGEANAEGGLFCCAEVVKVLEEGSV